MSLADLVNKKRDELIKLQDEIAEVNHYIEQILPSTNISDFNLEMDMNGGMYIKPGNGSHYHLNDAKAVYEFLKAYFEDQLPE
jgi:hypothetical protein